MFFAKTDVKMINRKVYDNNKEDISMKKRVISVVLLLCMMLTMLPTVDFSLTVAEAAETTDPATTGKNAPIDFASSTSQVCPVCGGSAKEWKPLPQITAKTTLAAGHYYIPEGGISNTAEYTFADNGVRCIHLNGNTLSCTTRLFNVTNNARINIFGSGTVNGNTGKKVSDGAIAYMSTSRVYLYGGNHQVNYGTPYYIAGSSGNLYIYSGATISGGTVSNVTVTKGKATMSGGTITGGKAANGGNVYITGGSFTMSGGTISSGTATTSGGNVYVGTSGTFTMTGGTISGGTASKYGGNVHSEKDLTVTGTILNGSATAGGGNLSIAEGKALTVKGTVAGGVVTGTSGAHWGGNIRAWHATVNIEDGALLYGGNGGSSKPGSANIGCLGEDAGKSAILNLNGGIVVGDIHTSAKNGEFPGTIVNVNGTPVVTKSYTVAGKTYTARQGIYMHPGNVLDITNMTGGSLCVTGEVGQALTTKHENAAMLKGCIVSSSTSQQVDLVDGVFYLAEKQAAGENDFNPGANGGKAVCPVCGVEKTWTAYSGTGTLGEQKNGAHIYLSGNRTATGANQVLSVAENATVCFNLNGYTLSMDGRIAIAKAGTTLNIMDTVGTGVVTSTGTRTENVLYNYTLVNQNNGVMNLYGGTFRNTNADYAVVRCSVGSAEINIYDGAVIDGNAQTRSILHVAGKLNIHGGIIKNGLGTTAGGNIRSEGGTLTIKGGTIFGGKATSGGNIYALNATVNVVDDNNSKTDAPQILNGSASSNGGNIMVGTSATMNMSVGMVSGGSATAGNGGNIALAGESGKKATLNLNTGVTIRDGAAKSAGNIYINYGTVNVEGASILGGYATSNAGSIQAATQGTLNLKSGLIDGGLSEKNGGNLYLSTTTSRINISGGTVSNGVTNNSGNSTGGGNIYANNGYVTMTGGVVSGGRAEKTYGGNIFCRTGMNNEEYNVDNRITINDDGNPDTPKPLITGGVSKNTGGNIYVYGDRYARKNAHLTLGDCRIENGDSTSYNYGDDLSLPNGGVMKILSNCTVEADIYVDPSYLPAVIFGGKVDDRAIITEGPFPGKLVMESYTNKYQLVGKEGETSMYICSSGIKKADGTYIWATDNAEIIAAAKENEGCTIYAAPGEMHLDGGEYTIDLRGNAVNFTGNGTVNLVDSTNDTFKTFGTASAEAGVTVNTGFVAENYYVLQIGETYSAHRINYNLTKVTLRPSAGGIYFTGKWACDETLAQYIDTYGVAVSVKAKPEADFATDGSSKWSWYEKENFVSGAEQTGVLIKGILKDGRLNTNSKYGQMPIYAAAYITIDGNTAVCSGMTYSLHDVLQIIDENINTYHTEAPTMQAFMATWSSQGITGEAWDFAFQPSQDAININTAYADRNAYHGEFHDHADTGGKSDGKVGLTKIKEVLEAKNMDFTTLLDHFQILHMELDEWDSRLFIGGSEMSTIISDGPSTGNSIHVNMIFNDAEKFKDLMAVHNPGGKYEGGKFTYHLDTESGNWYYDEHKWTIAEFKQLIEDIKTCGGMYVFPHPKDGSRWVSDDPLDYYFADWVGLEVFYGTSYYAPTGQRTVDAYKLWTDLLKAGKKLWATAGSDNHSVPNTNALTTIFSTEKNAVEHFEHAKLGDLTCGPVGIRMVMGDTVTGGETSFEGKRLSICVSDFHSSATFEGHTYRMKVIAGKNGAEEVIYTAEVNPDMPFYYGLDADNACDYYRVEVYDESDTRITTGMPTAIGNPIWNIK